MSSRLTTRESHTRSSTTLVSNFVCHVSHWHLFVNLWLNTTVHVAPPIWRICPRFGLVFIVWAKAFWGLVLSVVGTYAVCCIGQPAALHGGCSGFRISMLVPFNRHCVVAFSSSTFLSGLYCWGRKEGRKGCWGCRAWVCRSAQSFLDDPTEHLNGVGAVWYA